MAAAGIWYYSSKWAVLELFAAFLFTDIKKNSLENIAGDYCDILQPFIFILWCTVEVLPHLYRCCVGGCDSDSRYPEKVLKKGQVTGDLTWHYFPKDSKERALWMKNILKRLEDCEDCEPWNMLSLIMCWNHLNQLPYVYSWSYSVPWLSRPGFTCVFFLLFLK